MTITVQISIIRLVQLHNQTTADYTKWCNDKINACENKRINKPDLFSLNRNLKKKKFDLVSN